AVAVLGEVPVEAVDRQVECTLGVPADVEVALVERPLAGLGGERIPVEAFRLVEPEAIRIGMLKLMKLRELARADARVEAFGDRVNGLAHTPWLMSITNR